jgi:hypothetical protein
MLYENTGHAFQMNDVRYFVVLSLLIAVLFGSKLPRRFDELVCFRRLHALIPAVIGARVP